MFDNAGTEEEGNILHCEQYGLTKDICESCIPSHTVQEIVLSISETLSQTTTGATLLTNSSDTKHFCYRTDLENCTDTLFEADTVNFLNKVTCETCYKGYFSETDGGSFWHAHFMIPHCKYTMTRKVFS